MAIHFLQDGPDVGTWHTGKNICAISGFHCLAGGLPVILSMTQEMSPPLRPCSRVADKLLFGFLNRKVERADFSIELRDLIGHLGVFSTSFSVAGLFCRQLDCAAFDPFMQRQIFRELSVRFQRLDFLYLGFAVFLRLDNFLLHVAMCWSNPDKSGISTVTKDSLPCIHRRR
jgi:hypothetical protein